MRLRQILVPTYRGKRVGLWSTDVMSWSLFPTWPAGEGIRRRTPGTWTSTRPDGGGNTGTTNSLPSHVHVNPLRHGDHPDLGHLRTMVASQMSTVQQPAQLLITLLQRLKEVC